MTSFVTMRSSTTLAKLYIVILLFSVTYLVYVYFVKCDIKWFQKESKNQQRPPKYILLWTPQRCAACAPFDSFGEGRYGFKRVNCSYSNCYITANRNLLDDYTKFDAILFNGRQVMHHYELPQRREAKQLYVFVQLESADRFPVCNKNMDNFFNRTFTYKLDSDFLWPYMDIKDMNGNIVGPRVNMTWIPKEDMLPVSAEFGDKLRKKNLAAAWFVSNCESRSRREGFGRLLKKELTRFNLSVDIYGKCGTLTCPRHVGLCDRYLQVKYFFYLAFENSFSEDYITEKVLTGLLNNVVPVLYGGANYTRFLPDGSYIDGRRLGPANTARTMYEMMMNETLYRDMFRWKQHYKFTPHWPPPLCSLCEHLHKPQEPQVYKNFREWWYPDYRKRC